MTGILGALAGFGTTAGTLNGITDRTISRNTVLSTATCTYTIRSNGTVTGPGTAQVLETWLGGGSPASYDVRATVQSGALDSGTVGTWLNLSSDRSWSVIDDNHTSAAAVILVELRNAGSGSAIESATITMTANWSDSGGGGGLE